MILVGCAFLNLIVGPFHEKGASLSEPVVVEEVVMVVVVVVVLIVVSINHNNTIQYNTLHLPVIVLVDSLLDKNSALPVPSAPPD